MTSVGSSTSPKGATLGLRVIANQVQHVFDYHCIFDPPVCFLVRENPRAFYRIAVHTLDALDRPDPYRVPTLLTFIAYATLICHTRPTMLY